MNGDLPAALLFANPAFLRPLTGLAVPQRSHLHLVGVDLARSPDGRWWVIADRTQAPSGTGYALQNRTIVSDVMPEAFRTANVQRLLPSSAPSVRYSSAWRRAIIRARSCLRQDPTMRLTSSIPTWLDISDSPWPKEADLTVRDRRVYLKTV